MAKIQFETGQVVEFDGNPTPQDIEEVAANLGLNKQPTANPSQMEKPVSAPMAQNGLFGNVRQEQFNQGERNIAGNVFERPGAANRSALMALAQGQNPVKAYEAGAVNPGQVPRFQDMAIEGTNNLLSKIPGVNSMPEGPQTGLRALAGMIPSAVGMAGDIATNPADLLLMLAGKTPTGGGVDLAGRVAGTKAGQAVGKFVNADIGEVTADSLKGLASKIKGGWNGWRDFKANDVNAIRSGFWNKYAPQEYKAYGDAIETLPKTGKVGIVSGNDFMPALESKLVDRGLIQPDGVVIKAGIKPADRKLLNAYESIGKKWADSPKGELSMQDIVDIYKDIRGPYSPKPTSAQRDRIEAANTFFNAVADQIDNAAFTAAKLKYRNFKEIQSAIDSKIDLYPKGGATQTGRGENWLSESLIKNAEDRKIAQTITKVTGKKLTGAKTEAYIKSLNPLNLVRMKK